MTFPQAREADIALLLEGTFPYVSGGVSSWVDQIIRAFPELRFAIVFIGSRREDYEDMKYSLPDNVVHLEAHYLYDFVAHAEKPKPRRGSANAFARADRLHDAFLRDDAAAGACAAFSELIRELMPGGRLPEADFLHGEEAWRIISDRYRKNCTDPSFVDYFWTVRMMHAPLWKLARVAHALIPVKAFHAVSTGYAGLLGSMLRRTRQRPLILSEHGIYTKERKIDLFKSEWIRDNRNIFQRDPTELSYFRQMWIRFFEWLGRLCYDSADPIIALYEANRLRQVADGALAERTVQRPQRHQPAAFRTAARPPPGNAAAGTVPDRARGADQGREDVHPRHAPGGEPDAGGGRLDRRAAGRRPRLRRRVPPSRCQSGPCRQGEVPRFPEGRGPPAEDRPDHSLVDQRSAAPGHP